MSIQIQRQRGTLSVQGLRELSAANARAFRAEVSAALVPGLEAIEVDLSQTSFVDSSGLGALISVYKSANQHSGNGGVTLRLLNLTPPVQQVFELTRMHHLFEIVRQEEPAVDGAVVSGHLGNGAPPGMKAVLPLFIFIDACGWEIIKDDPFASAFAPHRRRLESVFGYSSACVPAIVSGNWPVGNRNWCYFVYDPEHSPFKALRPLRWLPRAMTSRRIFRRWLSKMLKAPLKFRGYFDLYNIPFHHISLFNFTEKRSPLRPGGMNKGRNIFDFLEVRDIPYHVSDPARSETENLNDLLGAVKSKRIDFAFVYWPELDGLLHRVGNLSAEVPLKLRLYEQWIERLLEAAQEHYREVRLYVFSDHGMANCEELLDLRSIIEALPVQLGKDYAVVYDSTMARFWFFHERACQLVTQCLNEIPQGRILSDHELDRLHCLFPDRYFGELIFLVREGVLIVPSDMGERPIRAMHGYHPGDKHSYAALLTNQPDTPDDILAIPDIFKLMTRDAELAHSANAANRNEGREASVAISEQDLSPVTVRSLPSTTRVPSAEQSLQPTPSRQPVS